MNRLGFRRHVAVGIDIDVIAPAARDVIDELDRTDLDDAMALGRIEAGGFGIEDDFAHGQVSAESLSSICRTSRRA